MAGERAETVGKGRRLGAYSLIIRKRAWVLNAVALSPLLQASPRAPATRLLLSGKGLETLLWKSDQPENLKQRPDLCTPTPATADSPRLPSSECQHQRPPPVCSGLSPTWNLTRQLRSCGKNKTKQNKTKTTKKTILKETETIVKKKGNSKRKNYCQLQRE